MYKFEQTVFSYPDNGKVEIETSSPLGEDIVQELSIADFEKKVASLYNDFDVDEHVKGLIIAENNGLRGVPSSVEALVDDAKKISRIYETLTVAIMKAQISNSKEKIMTIKEAYQICANAEYSGSEEKQKKHKEALKALKDNLELNQYVTTDIVSDYYANARRNYHGYECGELTYADRLRIAKAAVAEIRSMKETFKTIADVVYDVLGDYAIDRNKRKGNGR